MIEKDVFLNGQRKWSPGCFAYFSKGENFVISESILLNFLIQNIKVISEADYFVSEKANSP